MKKKNIYDDEAKKVEAELAMLRTAANALERIANDTRLLDAVTRIANAQERTLEVLAAWSNDGHVNVWHQNSTG